MQQNTTSKSTLECRNISFLSTISGDKWYTRIYSPPVIAQFLNDVSFQAFSGGIHAICGVSGSGKTTLLNVVASCADGDSAGSVLLNDNLLSKSRFLQVGAYVRFEAQYPKTMTVRSLMYYNLKLSLGGSLSETSIEQRILQVMKEFEILPYAYVKLHKLSESARKRALIATAAVKDPIVLLVDEPTGDLEALSSFQIMNCLHNYAKNNNRIIIITMQNPRSDIYQLLNTMTILFYGEVFYSGFIKKIPAYFQAAGFPCPVNENPAAYYISIATIDRETAARCEETQEQAMMLIGNFKDHMAQQASSSSVNHSNIFSSSNSSALCYLKEPTSASKLLTLCQRNIMGLFTNAFLILLTITAFPLTGIFLSMFSLNMLNGSWTIPHSSFSYLEISIFLLSLVTILVTNVNYRNARVLSYFESSEGLYNQMISAWAHILIFCPLYSIGIGITVMYLFWMNNMTDEWIIFQSYLQFAFICFFFQFLTMTLMIVMTNDVKSIGWVIILSVILLLLGGGHLRSFNTMNPSWLNYLSYLSPYRYNNFVIINKIIDRLPIENCRTKEGSDINSISPSQYCRWNRSLAYKEELYGEFYEPADVPSNVAINVMLSILVFAFMLFIHALKKSKFLVNKFKYNLS